MSDPQLRMALTFFDSLTIVTLWGGACLVAIVMAAGGDLTGCVIVLTGCYIVSASTP